MLVHHYTLYNIILKGCATCVDFSKQNIIFKSVKSYMCISCCCWEISCRPNHFYHISRYFKKPLNSVNSNDVNTKESSCVNSVNDSSSACNIYFILKQPYHQPKDFTFPKTKFRSHNRSCQHNWFHTYPWLHYDLEKDWIFCFYCMKNVSKLTGTEENKEPAYILVKESFWVFQKAPKQ